MLLKNNYIRENTFNSNDRLNFIKNKKFNFNTDHDIYFGKFIYNNEDVKILTPINYSHVSRYKNVSTINDEYRHHVLNKFVKLQKYTRDIFIVTNNYVNRLDKISYKFYNQDQYWWLIAYYNNIYDPLTEVYLGKKLYIPSINLITELAR